MRRRLIVIGIGGASCSGKTSLAKHICKLLPKGTSILHQDDFAPPADKVPYSLEYPGIQDWDDPPTCILWPEFRSVLSHVRKTGTLPDVHLSHDHLNKQDELQLDPDVVETWRVEFDKIRAEYAGEGVELIWFLVDGFVLYWDPDIVDMLDVRLFLRVPPELLKRRREDRSIYVLQNPLAAAAGDVWEDPPHYFEQIVYPAYIKAHEDIFVQGDVNRGQLREDWGPSGRDLHVFEPLEGAEEMTRTFAQSCEAIIEAARSGVGCFP